MERVESRRYQFPYAEKGRRRPDPPWLLVAAVRSAVAATAGQRSAARPGDRRSSLRSGAFRSVLS